MSDRDRAISIAYGAASRPDDEYPRRIAYLIGPDGTIVEAHASVNAAKFPHEQLARLQKG